MGILMGNAGFDFLFITFILGYFEWIDLIAFLVKKIYFYKKPETQFFIEYLNNYDKPTEKSTCRSFCNQFIRYEDKRVNVTRFKQFLD